MRFTALDFEKANRFSHSICSVGLVVFEDDEIVEEKHLLIQPPNNKYELSHIHRIHPELTINSPCFADVWDELSQYITSYPLVAHNALSVERAYITKTLNFYNLEVPDMKFVCTMELAKRFFSYVPSYSLAHICKVLNVDFDKSKHHDALYDAKKAGEVLLRMKESFMLSDDLEPIYISPSERRKSESRQREKKIPTKLAIPDLEIEDKSHLFYGKKIVFTGTFEFFPDRSVIAKLIHAVGGDNNSSISRKTDFVIMGENAGSSKMRKIEELNVQTLNENEFIELFSAQKFLDMM